MGSGSQRVKPKLSDTKSEMTRRLVNGQKRLRWEAYGTTHKYSSRLVSDLQQGVCNPTSCWLSSGVWIPSSATFSCSSHIGLDSGTVGNPCSPGMEFPILQALASLLFRHFHPYSPRTTQLFSRHGYPYCSGSFHPILQALQPYLSSVSQLLPGSFQALSNGT